MRPRRQRGGSLARVSCVATVPALLVALAAVGCGGSSPVSPSQLFSVSPSAFAPGRVAIISVDGLRPDAILRTGAPHILGLAGRGAYTWNARTVMPSTTLPSHVSMLSGYTPDVHGMVWDDYLASSGPIPVPTLFTVARGQGRRTAMVAGKQKFTYFCETGACDVWSIGTAGDDDVTARLSVGQADLLFVHLPEVDITGHASQWMSESYLAAVRRADDAVGRVLSALPSDMTVILTADHGGHDGGHGSSAAADMTIPWIVAGPRIVKGRQLSSGIRTVDTAATAAYLLGVQLSPSASGRPVLEAFISQ